MSIITLDGRLADPELEQKLAPILKHQYRSYYVLLALFGMSHQILTSLFYWQHPLWAVIPESMCMLLVGHSFAFVAAATMIVPTLIKCSARTHDILIFVASCLLTIAMGMFLFVKTPDGQTVHDLNYGMILAMFAIAIINNFTYGDIRLNILPSLVIIIMVTHALDSACDINTILNTSNRSEYTLCSITMYQVDTPAKVKMLFVGVWLISIFAHIAQARQVRLVYVSSSLNLSQAEHKKLRKNSRNITPDEHKILLKSFDQLA